MTKFEILQSYKSTPLKLLDSWFALGKNFIQILEDASNSETTKFYSKDLLYILNCTNSSLNKSLIFCTEELIDASQKLNWENVQYLDSNQGYISFGNDIISPNFRVILSGKEVIALLSARGISDISQYTPYYKSFIPFAQEYQRTDVVQISEEDYQEIISCLGTPFVDESILEYNRSEISSLALRPALREFFKWCPAAISEEVQVSRSKQNIPMPSDAYCVLGLSLQQNGTSAMGDTTNPFSYAWEQAYFGGNTNSTGIGIYNTGLRGVANGNIINSITSRAVSQSIINYSRRVHYEGPYTNADGSKYIVVYSNLSGTFNIWWGKQTMNFNDVEFAQRENAIKLCQAKVMQLFGNLRRQAKSDIPGVVDYNYLITEGTAMEKEVITELKSLVKSSGVIRGSL